MSKSEPRGPDMAPSCNDSARDVLVVDDDENDVLLLRRAFQKLGLPHRLTHITDGQQAINYLQNISIAQHEPSLLLLDLKMPLLDGFDVLHWLQTSSKGGYIPVVVLSSSSLVRDKEKAQDLGAKDYVTKPYDMDELKLLVQALHDRWLRK